MQKVCHAYATASGLLGCVLLVLSILKIIGPGDPSRLNVYGQPLEPVFAAALVTGLVLIGLAIAVYCIGEIYARPYTKETLINAPFSTDPTTRNQPRQRQS